jgi:hypothetical protein
MGGLMEELIERMDRIQPFKRTDLPVFSWPGYGQDESAAFDDAFARVTGYVGADWRYASQFSIDREVSRCVEYDAQLCVFVSPPKPDPKLSEAIAFVREQWKRFLMMLRDRVKIAMVFVDLEAYKYKTKHPLSDKDRKHNEWVGIYNRAIYKYCKKYSKGAGVRWYEHLAMHRRWPDAPAHWTDPYDHTDGHYGVTWYNLEDTAKCYDDLRGTIKYAHMHGVKSGSIWMSPGMSKIGWFCAGMPLLRQVAGGVYENPYYPRYSFRAGRYAALPWFESQSSLLYPDFSTVDSIVLWPGNCHWNASRTDAVHRVALLEGVDCKINYDERLTEIQKEMWEGGVDSTSGE